MKILFISENLVAGNIAYKIASDDQDVKLFIKDAGRKDNFNNLVKKTNDWKKELNWVGKNGLIVFDSGSHG